MISGDVIYLHAFDVAYEMRRDPVARLLGMEVTQFTLDATKRSPRQLSFYRPQMVRLPPVERIGPRGPVRVERIVKFLPIGALSITVRIPFAVERLEELVDFHDLHLGARSLYDEVRELAEQARVELQAHCIKPTPALPEEEAYTVFAIHDAGVPQLDAQRWLREHRRVVASLLTQEHDCAGLSEQEVEESTARALSYYGHDIVVIDWDAAVVVDDPRDTEELVFLMELANLQLAELEAYDQMLDQAVERAYRDLKVRSLWTRTNALVDLREIRIDLSRLSDELSNITKFFGDWHLARVYQALSDRFHLADWHRSIDGKLTTLDGLYQLHAADQHTRQMLILEALIVLLFVVDLALIGWLELGKPHAPPAPAPSAQERG